MICTSNKNKSLKNIKFRFLAIFWNLLRSKFQDHFEEEVIPWSPMFLDFPTGFHMVWKNQENCESRLAGFWVSRCSKISKILVTNFWAAIMVLLTTRQILIKFWDVSSLDIEWPWNLLISVDDVNLNVLSGTPWHASAI